MIADFQGKGTADVFDGLGSRAARQCCPADLWKTTRRKLDQLNRVLDVFELSIPPGNRLEALKGKRLGQYSIRINEQYRICFRWEGEDAYAVEITDYH